MTGISGNHIDRQLNMYRSRTRAIKHGKGFGDDLRQGFRLPDGFACKRNLTDHTLLVVQLMQVPFTATRVFNFIDTRDHQHRNRICQGLRHCCHDVGHTRAGDDKAHPDFARRAVIAVGHKACTLLVTRGHMADIGTRQATI